jgi:hypothetical protein
MSLLHTGGHNLYTANKLPIRCKRKCGFSKRYNPLRDFLFNDLASVMDPDVKIPIQSLNVNVEMIHSISLTTLNQVYKNTTNETMECVYKFPASDKYIVTGIEVKVGDKVIEAEIMEREAADEKYDDAVAAGHTAINMKHDSNQSDIISLNVGNLLPDQEVEVNVKFLYKMESTNNPGSFSYIFPFQLIPGVKRQINLSKSMEKIVEKFNWKFTMRVKLSSEHVITKVN